MTHDLFISLLADELMAEPEWLTDDAQLVDDLGMQSIDVVALVERIEEDQGVSIVRLDMSGVETVADLWACIQRSLRFAAA